MTLTSWAQNFEDVMLWRAFSDVGPGFFVDIGAQEPELDSVSRAFQDAGWRGVHVEATPAYAAAMRAARPHDRIIEAAVSDRGGVMRFFEFPGTGLSTGDPDIAARHRDAGFEMTEVIVPTVTLRDIFSAVDAPEIHWLKIDVEGMERQVLAGWGDAPHRPWVVLVESTLPLSQQQSHAGWEAELTKRGYRHVYWDGVNRFYLAREREELAGRFTSPPSIFDDFSIAPTHWLAKFIVQSGEQAVRAAETRLDERTQEVDALSEAATELRQRLRVAEDALAASAAQATDLRASLAVTEDRLAQKAELLSEVERASALLQSELAEAEARALAESRQLAEVQAILQQREQDNARLAVNKAEMQRSATMAAKRIEQLQSELASRTLDVARAKADAEAARDAEENVRAAADAAMAARNADVHALESRIAAVAESRAWRWLGPFRGKHRDADLIDRDALGATWSQGVDLVLNAELAQVPASVPELLELHDARFVRAGYRAILGREPDPAGAAHYLRRIRAGGMRRAMIVEWARSAEGRRRGSRIAGLGAARSAVRRTRTPLVRSLTGAERLRGLDRRVRQLENRIAAREWRGRLPGQFDQADAVNFAPSATFLFMLEGEAFVRAAYAALLRREPDPDGMRYYLGRLADGRSKVSVVDQMCRSKEYREKGQRLPGLGAARRRMRLTHAPIIGAFVQGVIGGEGNSRDERRVRRLAFLFEREAARAERPELADEPEGASSPLSATDGSEEPQAEEVARASSRSAGGLPLLTAQFTPKAQALFGLVRRAQGETLH